MAEDTNRFDDCNLTNVKLYLNSECYPFDDMNLDFDKNRWSVLYETYARFCKGYYGYEYLGPSLTVTSFLHNGPFVVDRFSTIRIRQERNRGRELEFETKENVPMNTSAYCLIIHDRVVHYNPLTNVIHKIT
ncbi:hypothetical protein P5V15_015553 [Pogonomyrmex californicus]